ncbi:BrnT family toxin [Allopontixanthobacter sp.]|uniref:BrnT family toxin n=1 Tax=Allopontixanthobacter sp. TaxID=2906452 RepID=UPI002AB8769C|nr:BrnT family toxin [Allopontixanthobacter sp.]MDZ4306762.1 BrnT family toxin [Allopontixanthobacter sp.]
MIFEYDAAKSAANLAKHGVSLDFGQGIFDDLNLLVLPTIRHGDEEERYKVIGNVDDRLWTAIYVYRGEAIRLISVRRSNGGEQRAYHSD